MGNMYNNKHGKFITAPIINILQETVDACDGIGEGIETQSISEYVFQTTFLKMTGALEQKLKCICWELATNDYEYRYRFLNKNYGECSSYADKNSVYKDLCSAISKMEQSFVIYNIFEDIDFTLHIDDLIKHEIEKTRKKQEFKKKRFLNKDELEKLSSGIINHFLHKNICDKTKNTFRKVLLFRNIKETIDKIIEHSLLLFWGQHSYFNYTEEWDKLSNFDFAIEDALFDNELQKIYTDIIYSHRNRCAHNLKSYQDNIPPLKDLCSVDNVYNNYYFRFSMLALIDEIFIRLYNTYIDALDTEI